MLSLMLMVATAAADPVEIYSRINDWPTDETIVGVDGWRRGYDFDEWWGMGDYLMSTSDVGGEEFGGGGPADNYLVMDGLSVYNGSIVASMTTWDDDTMGSVFRHQDGGNYYGAMLVGSSEDSGGYGSNPFGLDAPRAALVKVQDGEVTILDEISVTATAGSDVWVLLGGFDDYVYASFYSNYEDFIAGDAAVELGTHDTGGLGAGSMGLYTYNAGGTDGGWGTEDDWSKTIFEAVILTQEEDEADTDTDTDADTDTDTDTDTGVSSDTGGMSDRDRTDGLTEVGADGKLTSCRCATGPDGRGLPGLGLWLGLAGLVVRVRRSG